MKRPSTEGRFFLFTAFKSVCNIHALSDRNKKSKQIGTYVLRNLRLESGERLPLLRDAVSGEPLYDPLLFSLFELRGSGSATNTIAQALRGVMLLLYVLRELDVDITERLGAGQLLTHSELEGLARACSLPLKELREEADATPSRPGVVSLREAVRMRAGLQSPTEVEPSTKAIRLHYAHKYLMWLADRALLRLAPSSAEHAHLMAAKAIADGLLRSRIPSGGKRNTEDRRQGLAATELARLLEVIQPGHADNPWRSDTQVRNNLMVRWLLKLGLRRAELCGAKVSDINFRTGEVLIARRPIDSEDPRADKPVVKTRDKLLPMDPNLSRDVHNYVVGTRRATGNAKRHPFLFVATGSGAPLSMGAVNLVFASLRARVPGLPEELTPHVLRHTWNDEFSELAEGQGFSDAEESKMRSRLMGWSESSGTAATYTRRHVKRKARQASLAMQEKLTPKRGQK